MSTKISARSKAHNPDLLDVFEAIINDMTTLRTALAASDMVAFVANVTAMQVDIAALRGTLLRVQADEKDIHTTLAAVQTDVAAIYTGYAALIAKLNLDTGVTDENYANPAAKTSAAPVALTSSAPNAVTSAAPAAISVTDPDALTLIM
jgi:hypothetical protein